MDRLQLLLNFIGAIGVGGFLGSLVTLFIGAKLRKQEIIFSTLHAKRADIIAELYKFLVKAKNAFAIAATKEEDTLLPSVDKRVRDALNAVLDFSDFYNEHRIYFNESLTLAIDAFIQPFEDVFYDLAEVKGTKSRDFEAAQEKLNLLVQPLSTKIQNEFQRMIGNQTKQRQFRWFEPESE